MALEAVHVYFLHKIDASTWANTLWLIMLTVLTLSDYRTGLQYMRIRIWIGFALIGITYLTTITAILAGCGAPFQKNWQIYPDPGSMSPHFRRVLNFDKVLIVSRPLPACHI